MFFVNYIILLCVFIFFLLASYSDLKSRTISNNLILFFLILGLSYNITSSLILGNFKFLLTLLYSVLLSFVVFLVLWELGVIAGGDAKLFIALAFIMPNFENTLHIFNLGYEKLLILPIFPILLFIASAFMVLPWILLYSKYLLIKKRYYKELLQEIFSKNNLLSLIDSILVVILAGLIISAFGFSNIFLLLFVSFILTYTIFKLKRNNGFYLIIFGLFLLVRVILISTNNTANLSFSYALNTAILVIVISILIIYLKYIKDKVFIEKKKIKELKEGDLLVYSYYYKNKKLILKKYNFMEKIKAMVSGEYYKDLKVDSGKAKGLSRKDITFLKDMYNNRLIGNAIYLKKTIAFTPATLLAYMLLIIF